MLSTAAAQLSGIFYSVSGIILREGGKFVPPTSLLRASAWKRWKGSDFAARWGWEKKDGNAAFLCACLVCSTRYVCQAMRMQRHEL